MGITTVTPPTIEPVQLQEMRDHLRLVTDDEDALIEGMIVAARELAEVKAHRIFIETEFKETFNQFPGWPFYSSPLAVWPSFVPKSHLHARDGFPLARSPALAITEIKYIDIEGVEQELSTDIYRLISDDPGPKVVLKYNQVWPTARDEEGAVRITYTAGYGSDPESVPACFRHAVKLLVGHFFDNREPYVTGTIVAEIPMTVRALLKAKGLVQIR